MADRIKVTAVPIDEMTLNELDFLEQATGIGLSALQEQIEGGKPGAVAFQKAMIAIALHRKPQFADDIGLDDDGLTKAGSGNFELERLEEASNVVPLGDGGHGGETSSPPTQSRQVF